MKCLFATTNKAKIRYYVTKLRERGIEVITLEDLNMACDIDETGKTQSKMPSLKRVLTMN